MTTIVYREHSKACGYLHFLMSRQPAPGSRQICKDQLLDLVLLDVMMPEMDGYETCRKLKEFTDIPIIFATVSVSLEDHLKAFDASAEDLITKPIVPEILVRKVLLAIQRKKELEKERVEKNSLHSMCNEFSICSW